VRNTWRRKCLIRRRVDIMFIITDYRIFNMEMTRKVYICKYDSGDGPVFCIMANYMERSEEPMVSSQRKDVIDFVYDAIITALSNGDKCYKIKSTDLKIIADAIDKSRM
jgi:hypothetical protein